MKPGSTTTTLVTFGQRARRFRIAADRAAIAPAFFARIEGLVGAVHYHGKLGAVRWERRDADADRRHDVLTVCVERRSGNRLAYALGYFECAIGAGLRQQHYEFVAAVTRKDVGFA